MLKSSDFLLLSAPASLPPATHLDVIFSYILSCIKSVLLVFRLFAEIIALCAVAILMCSGHGRR